MDMIARQHTLDDLHAHFTTDLPDDVPHPLPQFPLEHLVAILGDPDDVIAVVKNRVTSSAVGHTLLSKKGLHTSWVRALFWREEYEATAQASLRLKTEV